MATLFLTENCEDDEIVADSADFIPFRGRRPLTESEKYLLCARSGWLCIYCGTPCEGEEVYDHVIPVCDGGWTSFGNMALACYPCNSSKGDKRLVDFRHKMAIRDLAWPKLSREQLAWAESRGADIEAYRSWLFWFEASECAFAGYTRDALREALEADRTRKKQPIISAAGHVVGYQWNAKR